MTARWCDALFDIKQPVPAKENVVKKKADLRETGTLTHKGVYTCHGPNGTVYYRAVAPTERGYVVLLQSKHLSKAVKAREAWELSQQDKNKK